MSQTTSNNSSKNTSNSKHITYLISGAFVFGILGYYYYSRISKQNNKHQNKILTNSESSNPPQTLTNLSNSSNKTKTKIWKIYPNKNLSFSDYLQNPFIAEAGKALSNGELIGFPTETVYGLGANAFSNSATNKIFIAKGRPNDNPLIVHISEINQLYKWILKPVNNNKNVSIHPAINKLITKYWPGPLSIVFTYKCYNINNKNNNIICSKVRGGGQLQSVAIRMPSNNIARALISLADCPIAAPSANISGRPSPTKGKHVVNDMNGKIYGILDCGEINCDIGLESTVIKFDEINNTIIILRPGAITKNMIYTIIKEYNIDLKYSNEIIKQQFSNNIHNKIIVEAPGMKYKHYAPKKPLYLIDNMDLFGDMYWYYKSQNKINNIVFIITKQNVLFQKSKENKNILVIGDGNNLNQIGSNLFNVLRKIDDGKEYENIELIFCQVFDKEDIGVAIMNRLNKASQSNKIINNLNDLQSIVL